MLKIYKYKDDTSLKLPCLLIDDQKTDLSLKCSFGEVCEEDCGFELWIRFDFLEKLMNNLGDILMDFS